MQISSFAIAPLLVASFVICAFQYYRVNPDRRLLNLRFGMMLGAVVLLFAVIGKPRWSLELFVLAIVWLGLSIYLLRSLPPAKH